MYKHGMINTKFYSHWKAMKARIKNKKHKHYKNYGGRGICIYYKWNDFLNFKMWMYESYLKASKKYGEENITLDRIDNNSHYNPGNCRWATRKEQSNNMRNNHLITFRGKTMTLTEWAEKMNLTVSALDHRINRDNWSIKRALTQSLQSRKP